MNVKEYNQKGEETGQADLPQEIFCVKVNPDLIHQVVVSQMANRRQGTAHSKGRGEARGGGRKPWRQKGTGRARHGSIRSPLWRGGGVTFGPSNLRNYKKKIPVKIARKALLMALSAKAEANLLVLLEQVSLEKISAKQMNELLGKLPCKTGSVLIALPSLDKKLILSARNIPQVKTMQARELNTLDVLSSKWLMMPKESVKVIRETFSQK